MAARAGAHDALPTSHFFITVARGRSARTFVPRSGSIFAGLAALPVILLWLLGSTAYLFLHDDLVASLMLRQRDMQYAYEDRIAALRTQVDRDTTRQLTTQRAVEAKLNELVSREAELQVRSAVVAQLGERVGKIGGEAAAPATLARSGASIVEFGIASAPVDHPVAMGDAPPSAPPSKPRPEAALESGDTLSGPVARMLPPDVSSRLSEVSSKLDTISVHQESRLTVLSARLRTDMARYRTALVTAGLTEGRILSQDAASGGPFVPVAREDDASPFARAAVGLQLTLSQAERLSASIRRVPFGKPLTDDPEITSPFGERVDPFLGRPAMHTGIDLREDNGTDVHATAPGRVTAAGPASGYGIMVEIDHGAGLVTRYAHLSDVSVSVGHSVRAGDVIGLVGATGRATGPHLHYETRVDGDAVDPLRFLAAGQSLHASQRPL